MAISVNLTVLPETESQASRVVEALARVATGLAFEGQTVSISITNFDPDEEDD